MIFPFKKHITNKRLGQLENSRNSNLYKEWRDYIISRDGKCLYPKQGGFCGNTEDLQAHHIKRYAIAKHLRFEKYNGITLCEECHKKIFSKEQFYEDLFMKIILNLYYGKKDQSNS